MSASMAPEVSSVRSKTCQASSRQGASTARSLAPLATNSGNPRTARAASSTGSFVTGLVVQPSKRPCSRTPTMPRAAGICRPRIPGGAGTLLMNVPLSDSSAMKLPSSRSMVR